MRIADRLEMLEINIHSMKHGPDIAYPALIWDDNEVVLIDVGMPGQAQQLREEFAKAGVPFEKLSKIIITHSDLDHAGGLASIINHSRQKISVLVHEKEKPYIEAELPPLRMAQMEREIKALSGEHRQIMTELYNDLNANYKELGVPIDKTVADNEELPYCGGITVIYTPGHTPGHICLYHKSSKTLIPGDALIFENGVLDLCQQHTMMDKEQYYRSLRKLTGFDIDTVLCYHGGIYRDNPNRRIAELAGLTL